MKLLRRALPLIFACATAGTAFAQDQPPAPVVVARLSMTSIDKFNALFADLGVPKTPRTDIQAIIEAVPFFGPGVVATDKPLGFTIWAADSQKLFPIQQSFVISVPILPGKVTLNDLKAAGATPLDGAPDSVTLNELVLRRTGDYVHFKIASAPFGLAEAGDHLFDADYKDPSNLYVAAADFAAFRKVAPNAYQDLAREITALPRMIGLSVPDDPKPVLSVLDKIDTLKLSCSQDPANFLFKFNLTPSPLATTPLEAPRPAFPAGAIAHVHMVYPTRASAAFLENQLDALPAEDFAMDMPPVYHQRAKDLVLRVAAMNSAASALSFAVSVKNGKPTISIVEQLSSDFDALQEITDIVNTASALAQEGAGIGIAVQGATYTDGTHKVQRLTLTPDAANGGPDNKVVIDEIQTGRTLYLTLSPSDDKSVAALADAGMDGKSTRLLTADLDMGLLLNEFPKGLVPPEAVQSLQGQKINLTVESTDKGLQIDAQAPKKIWRDLMRSGTQGQAGAQPQPTPRLP